MIASADDFPEDLILQERTVQSGENPTFIANNTIAAGPAFVIDSGARVIFAAANRITLRSGFVVRGGARLSLFINKDTDADGLFDWWEYTYFQSLEQGPGGDYDGDGLANLQEFQRGWNPASYNTDNDGDGLLDSWELIHFGDLTWGSEDDYDNDGFSNYLEHITDSDPANGSDTPAEGSHYYYDELGRLKAVVDVSGGIGGQIIQYHYDGNGNRTQRIVNVQP